MLDARRVDLSWALLATCLASAPLRSGNSASCSRPAARTQARLHGGNARPDLLLDPLQLRLGLRISGVRVGDVLGQPLIGVV